MINNEFLGMKKLNIGIRLKNGGVAWKGRLLFGSWKAFGIELIIEY